MTNLQRKLVQGGSFMGALMLPAFAFAQGSGTLELSNLQKVFVDLLALVDMLVPVIFAIAFIVFLWGVFTYFIAGGANDEKRKEGAKFVMWSIIGFVVMVSIWGIVNVFANTLGFNKENRPCLPTFSGPCKQN